MKRPLAFLEMLFDLVQIDMHRLPFATLNLRENRVATPDANAGRRQTVAIAPEAGAIVVPMRAAPR